MRDLLFKNLTSGDKKRKILVSSEVLDKQGIRSVIRRHFVCIVKEVKDTTMERPLPQVHIVKEHNTRQRREHFFCKIKGSVYLASGGKLFLILFMHSLNINLFDLAQDPVV
jgi:hypothetical protein